nr:NAD(P)H-dependent oxidoreductase [uncultured Desulfobacter sp.]
MKNIGIIVGSLREGSFNKAVANYVSEQFPEAYQTTFIDFSKLDIYNQDLDETPPESWVAFRNSVKGLDALLFVTPEYNRSIPGGLKNALDVGSRPYGQSVWGGKPGGVISVSPGAIGGFGANHHLRQVLSFLDVYTLQQPEAYVGHIEGVLDDGGQVVDEHTKQFLDDYAQAFIRWIEKF